MARLTFDLVKTYCEDNGYTLEKIQTHYLLNGEYRCNRLDQVMMTVQDGTLLIGQKSLLPVEKTTFNTRWENSGLEAGSEWVNWLGKMYQQSVALEHNQEWQVDNDIAILCMVASDGNADLLDQEYNFLINKQCYQDNAQAHDYLANAYDAISTAQYFLLLDIEQDLTAEQEVKKLLLHGTREQLCLKMVDICKFLIHTRHEREKFRDIYSKIDKCFQFLINQKIDFLLIKEILLFYRELFPTTYLIFV